MPKNTNLQPADDSLDQRSLGAIEMPPDPTLLRPSLKPSNKKRSGGLIKEGHPALTEPYKSYKKGAHRSRRAKKRRLLIIGFTVFFVIASVVCIYLLSRKPSLPSPPQKSSSTTTQKEVEPTTKPSALTGVMVEPEKSKKPVMASIIENMAGRGGARPQSGLSSAGVVYEALAEGGITRYLALWQADTPTDIGPVRSLRPVFFYSAMEHGSPTAHAGGSTDGLALAQDPKFKNIEALSEGAFRRIKSKIAPHNLYIYGEKYLSLITSRGWGGTPSFAPWQRKDDSPSQSPEATIITANFSSADYRAVFRYNPSSNSYLREVGGAVDIDASANNKQINPKVVIILKAPTKAGMQRNGKPKTDIEIIGKGRGYIFQDGKVVEIDWVKQSATERMQFLDGVGAPVSLNRGQTWVSIVPSTLPPSWK